MIPILEDFYECDIHFKKGSYVDFVHGRSGQ